MILTDKNPIKTNIESQSLKNELASPFPKGGCKHSNSTLSIVNFC